MNSERIEELNKIAVEVRKDILRMVGIAHSGPFETSIAATDLLVYLYWEELVLVPSEPRRADRDRFVIDIAEAVPALYAVLARRGFFEREHLWHYRRLGAMLQALPDLRRIPGIDAPCLTMQPAVAMAAALAGDLMENCESPQPRVFFLTSDRSFFSDKFFDEMKRIASLKLPNFVAIVLSRGQKRKIGAETIRERMDKLLSFGWNVRYAKHGDYVQLESACESLDFNRGGPKVLLVSAPAELGLSVSESVQPEADLSMSMGELDHALEELEEKSNDR